MQEKRSEVSRDVITKIGKSLFGFPDVRSVTLHVEFGDGSSIGYFDKDDEE